MSTSRFLSLCFIRKTVFAVSFGLILVGGLCAKTGSPTSVGYAPLDQTVEGNIPFTQSVVFTITAPFASSNVSMEVKSCLLGGTPAIGGAGSDRLSISPSTLSFSTVGETKQVTVTFTSPAVGAVAAGDEINYVYQIRAVGWASAVSNPEDHVSINATATAPLPTATGNPPVVVINPPLNGSVYTVAANAFPVSIPFQFTVTSSSSDYPIISADALFDGSPISTLDTDVSIANAYTPLTIANIGTGLATGSATLKVYKPGTYSVFARGANSVGPATAISSFTVNADGPPPVVTINAPLAGSTFVVPANATSVAVPFNFVASAPTGGVVRQLIVKVDGVVVPYAITSGALNTQNVGGTTLSGLAYGPTQTGSHVVSVTAKNEYGEDTDVTNFNIAVEAPAPTALTLSGVVFLDINKNGNRDAGEPVIPGVSVKLFRNNAQVGATVVSADPTGGYSFNVSAGSYEVDTAEPAGLVPTNPPVQVTIASTSVKNVDLGLALDLAVISKLQAGGFTIGYWKNNVEKAIAGKVGGTQVNAQKIAAYTTAIGTLALSPFTALTREAAVAIMASSSSAKTDLLAKQLLASEYNYENGGYIGGAQGATLTFAFVAWGEYVLLNGTDAQRMDAQKWFDAYNNSHGGVIGVPK